MRRVVAGKEGSARRTRWSRLRPLVRSVVVYTIVTGALAVAALAVDHWAFSSAGTNAVAICIYTLWGLATLSLLFSWIVLIELSFLGLFRHTRKFAVKGVLVCLVFNAIAFPTLRYGLNGRSKAFERLAVRSVPLVESIHGYEREHGTPPPSLEALVPQYFDAVPSTGIGAYPDYVYLIGDDAQSRSGCEWMLEVPAYVILGWDTFLYFPSGEYPERGFGGWLERMGDWAYVHE